MSAPNRKPELGFKLHSTGPEVELQNYMAVFPTISTVGHLCMRTETKGSIALFNLSWECVCQAT